MFDKAQAEPQLMPEGELVTGPCPELLVTNKE